MKLIHQDAAPEVIEVLRVWIFGIWLIKVLGEPLLALSELPAAFFNPAGFLIRVWPVTLQTLLLTEPALWALKVGLIVSLAGVLLKRFLRPAALLACLLLTVYQGVVRGFGIVNHAELALLYAAFLWTGFTWERQDAETASSLLVTMTAILCFTYTFVGVYRIVKVGWGLYGSDALTFWILENTLRPRALWIEPQGLLLLQYPLLEAGLKLAFPVGTVFEILAPFCLVSSIFRRLFLAVMIPFHLIILVFMGINFWEQLALYVLFLDLGRIFAPRTAGPQKPVIFFDGVCGLCNAFVDWVLGRDRTGVYQFAPLQGETARPVIGTPPADPLAWSIFLSDGGRVYQRSDAVLRILAGLGGLWKCALILLALPRAVRDGAYQVIARRRYRWFGTTASCRLPKPGEEKRFLP